MYELQVSHTNIMKADHDQIWDTVLDVLTSTHFGEQVREAIKVRPNLNGLRLTSFHARGQHWDEGIVRVHAL